MTETLDRSIDVLRAGFAGSVLTSADAAYDQARSLWNGAIDAQPSVVAQCADAHDVAMAVRFARDHDLEIAVRGGGHSFAGLSMCTDGLVVDLSRMRRVSVDPDARTAVAGGGATGADVDTATQAHGLATPLGTVSHTGVGGLTLGGGFGWLTPSYGLACQNVVAADVVTADGRKLHASADENADLFWAIRGGGGNFGVVTSFTYRLHPVGPEISFGMLFWDAEYGRDALRAVLATDLPASTGVMLTGMNAPPAPFVPEQHHFALGYALLLAGFGSQQEHHRTLDALRAAAPPLFQLETPMPYLALQQLLDESAPWGIHAYEKALYLEQVTDGAVDVMTDMLPRKTSPLSFMPSFPLYGAYGEGLDETAFAGTGTERFIFNVASMGTDRGTMEKDKVWAREFYDRMRPHAGSDRTYINFLGERDDERVRHSFGDKYARLAAIKAVHDPDNVFHRNPNIVPG